MFSTDKIGKGWNGANTKADIFSSIIILTDEMGAIRKKAGEVTLVR